MRYKIAPLTESLIAHCTRIGDLTTMYTFMSYKTAQVTKCLFTHTTSIRAVTTMYALMCFQIAPMTESLITHCTEIGELTTMIALMFCKTALVTEAHVTHFTGIWMLTPMYITGVPAFSTVYMMMFFHGILMFSLDWWKYYSFWNFILYIYGLINFNTDFFSSINITFHTCLNTGTSSTFPKTHAVLFFSLYCMQ
jgi:hypothetical protein